ncbi:MAG: SBBP repeat-containing protein [Fimbriimonadaceae bacterium]|nr:SBBP repeat-containing protein [Fimbriimonadaceae bacterium]
MIASNNKRFRRRLGLAAVFIGSCAVVATAALGLSQGNQQGGVSLGRPDQGGSGIPGVNTSYTYQRRFIENKGQWDGRAQMMARARGMNLWVTETGVYYDLMRKRAEFPAGMQPAYRKRALPKIYRHGHILKLEFVGGTPAMVQGWGEELGQLNWLTGGRTEALVAKVFTESRLRGVFPGVDMRLYWDNLDPRYDFQVLPGADPNAISLRLAGADMIRLKSPTNLSVGTSVGDLDFDGLYAYQEINGNQVPVSVSYEIRGGNTFGFRVGNYDRTKPLIIDPVVYSTLLGGTGSSDFATGVKVDRFNSAYVCGYASADTFPTTIGAYDEEMIGIDGFVSKVLPDGSDLEYSTYIGGDGTDACFAIDLDFNLNAYITGQTDSDNMGIGPTAAQPARTPADELAGFTADDHTDAFVLKVLPDGTGIDWGTYIGGERFDVGFAIAVGPANNVHVVGNAQSENLFPLVNAVQGAIMGDGDAFITKISPDGTTFVYSTYMGGTDAIIPDDPNVGDPPDDPTNPYDNTNTHLDDDQGIGVAVDGDGSAYILGQTAYNDIIKVPGSFDTVVNGWDAFVYKFTPDGTGFVYGTMIGGNNTEQPTGIAVDSTNNAYVTGGTTSFNFPRTTGVFDSTYNLGTDCFITKINRPGTGLSYSTFLGTLGGTLPQAIAVDDLGFAHVTGQVAQNTTSNQWLPVTANADDGTYNGPTQNGGDAFLLVMNPTGTGLLYCGYWGGSINDSGTAIAVDSARNSYIVGFTQSTIDQNIPFPTTPGAFKEAFPFDCLPSPCPDAFVSKIKTRIPYAIQSIVIDPNSVIGGESTTATVTISGPASTSDVLVSISNDNASVVSHPSTIVITPGTNSTTFTINTDSQVQATHVVKITATVEGDSKFATLTVAPWLQSLTLSNATVVGGNPVGARVNLNKAAPAGGITVNLNSTIPAVAQVPATLVVPEGDVTAVFDVLTSGVSVDVNVDISASYNGLTNTKTLKVIPAKLIALSFSPTRVTGGTPTTGTVQLDGFAPAGGRTVSLTSSNPAVQVPATVFVVEQTSSVSFLATTSVVPANTSSTITATLGVDQASAVVDVLYADLIQLAIVPASVLGGNPTTGFLQLDVPAAADGVTVALSSSNPAVASVPATVTIPAGSTNESFPITTVFVPVDTNVTITATRGSTVLNANLEVRRIRFNVTLNPTSVFGGQSSTGTVTLDEAAPQGGITFNLSSDNPAATVPTTLTIDGGNDSANFGVTTTAVAVTTLATISAEVASIIESAVLTINPAVPSSLTINPNVVNGGDSTTGTVTLTGPAGPGGVVVSLSSNNPAAIPPATVTVTAGQLSRSFTITTTAVAVDTVVTITASVGATNVNAQMTIIAARLTGIVFVPSKVRGGQTTQMTITLNAAAPPGGAVVTLQSSNPFVAAIPASVTVPAGATSRTVTVVTFRVSRTLGTLVTATYGSSSVFTILTATR